MNYYNYLTTNDKDFYYKKNYNIEIYKHVIDN